MVSTFFCVVFEFVCGERIEALKEALRRDECERIPPIFIGHSYSDCGIVRWKFREQNAKSQVLRSFISRARVRRSSLRQNRPNREASFNTGGTVRNNDTGQVLRYRMPNFSYHSRSRNGEAVQRRGHLSALRRAHWRGRPLTPQLPRLPRHWPEPLPPSGPLRPLSLSIVTSPDLQTSSLSRVRK